MKTVNDIMTEHPVQITSTETVADALAMMQTNPDIRHLPVIDHGELVGIVSDRDLRSMIGCMSSLSKSKQKGEIYHQFSIDCVMTRDVVTVAPTDSVLTVASLFGERKIGALPVLDNGKLVGIVSYIDLLNRYVIPLMELLTDDIGNRAAGSMDAALDTAISQHTGEQIALL